MSLNEIREGELKEVFTALEAAFTATGTDFYIIGAIARDVWYARGEKSFRRTRDLDFAVLVASQEEYLSVKNFLAENSQFREAKTNAFALFAPGGIQVDILPFGAISIDDTIEFKGQGLTSIKVNGFAEVYQTGTTTVELLTGHHFKVASLPSIVLLKMIAFDDRPEQRAKDAKDIASIITHYFDLQADFIYSHHIDLFEDETDSKTLEEISAIVIGREIKAICAGNIALLERLQLILSTHTRRAAESNFVRYMVEETNTNVRQCVQLLQLIQFALSP